MLKMALTAMGLLAAVTPMREPATVPGIAARTFAAYAALNSCTFEPRVNPPIGASRFNFAVPE